MLALPSKSTFYVIISIWHGNSSHTEPYIEYINTHSRYITSALTTLIDNSTLNIHQPTFLDPVANEVRAQSLNSFFIFYFLALSLRKFAGSHGIVPIYIFTILLRNTISRSSWKWIARMISHWFQVWCKYFAEFAHNIILYSKCSKKITGHYTIPKHIHLLWVPGVLGFGFGEMNEFLSKSDLFSAQRQHSTWSIIPLLIPKTRWGVVLQVLLV